MLHSELACKLADLGSLAVKSAVIDGPIAEPLCNLVALILRAGDNYWHWKHKELYRAVESEKKHRTEQAKHIIQRLLHSQLAYIFDSYINRVIETKWKGETCTRVVLRMQHRALVGAFDLFVGTVEQLRLCNRL
jgi:hypothetical protein